MTQTYFADRASPLGRMTKTPQGGVRVPAAVAREGVMLYHAGAMRSQGHPVPEHIRDDGYVRVYLPKDVLTSAGPTLADAPVTREHPSELVSTANYARHARGTVASVDGVTEGRLHARLTIQDAELISDIESGERQEVSAGYLATTAFEPGVTDAGVEYDAIRTAIEYNHVAVVKLGRAGRDVRLALDSHLNPFISEVDSVDQSTVTAPVADAAAILTVERDAALADAEQLRGELATVRAELDSVRAELVTARSQETIDAAVAVEMARKAEAALAADRRAAVARRYPKLDLTGRPQVAIDALYETLTADPDGLAQVTPPGVITDSGATAPAQPTMTARERMLAARRAELSAAGE